MCCGQYGGRQIEGKNPPPLSPPTPLAIDTYSVCRTSSSFSVSVRKTDVDDSASHEFLLVDDEDDNGDLSPVKTVDKTNSKSTKRNAPEPKGAQTQRHEESKFEPTANIGLFPALGSKESLTINLQLTVEAQPTVASL